MTLTVRPADVDERPLPGEAAEAMAVRLARAKAAAISTQLDGPSIVVAADTLVVRDGVILGKPTDAADAAEMLRSLSGRSHQVVTGFAVSGTRPTLARAVTTTVTFRPLSEAVIADYVATGEPLDKAGAYGIQGIGAMLVVAIEGSYTNVVGLPLVEVLDAIAEQGGPRR
jgi:septum formation protein